MVDSIAARGFAEASKSLSLKENFKSLSTQLPAAQVATAEGRVQVRPQPVRAQMVTGVVRHLSEAVSSSNLALQSLEEMATAGGSESTASAEKDALGKLAGEIGALQNDIAEIVKALKGKADTVAVMEENMFSSSVRLEDVDAAGRHAQEFQTQVPANSLAALDAHGGLSSERVLELIK